MHDSPQYAYLQTLERLHAACNQRLHGLESYLSSQTVPTATKSQLTSVIQKTQRMFSNAQAETILDSCPMRAFNRSEQRSIETSWQWLFDELESLSTALASGNVSPDVCDGLLDQLSKHAAV